MAFKSFLAVCLYTALHFDCFVAACSRDVATVPVAPIDLMVNLAAGSEF